jgi:hypothetical protein
MSPRLSEPCLHGHGKHPNDSTQIRPVNQHEFLPKLEPFYFGIVVWHAVASVEDALRFTANLFEVELSMVGEHDDDIRLSQGFG